MTGFCRQLEWWPGSYCNEIRGSDGTLFPSMVKENSKLSAFAFDICRSADLQYVKPGQFKDIPSMVFTLADTTFARSDRFPPNECFCIWKTKKKRHRCNIDGILDVGACNNKAPLILSAPHFLNTNPDLSKLVDGLNPNDADHGTYLWMEPVRMIFTSRN